MKTAIVKASEIARTGRMDAKFHIANARKLRCPNCGADVANHPDTSCVLGALIQVVRERGEMSERKLRKLHANTDADAFWTAVGKIVDDLEEGYFA